MEMWEELYDFPGYAVSSQGRVMNERTGRILVLTKNQRGRVMAGPVRNGVQHRRAVDLLVANAFLEPPIHEAFDTIVHLDGDVSNNDAENLMWRPRWFRVAYHRQFERGYKGPRVKVPVYVVDTDEVFENSRACAMKYGLLEKDIALAVSNRSGVWPYGYEIRVHKE